MAYLSLKQKITMLGFMGKKDQSTGPKLSIKEKNDYIIQSDRIMDIFKF